MAPPFELRIDAAQRRMTVVVRGCWDMAVVAAFAEANEAAFVAYRAEGGLPASLLVLVDVREAAVHPRDVSEAVEQIARRHAPYFRRIATIVSDSVIQLLQSRRIVASSAESCLFIDPREALAWLDEALNPETTLSDDRPDRAPRAG